MAPCMSIEEIILNLFEVEGIKFGDFVVRTGEHSPVYIDMRVIWSYPKLVVRLHSFIMPTVNFTWATEAEPPSLTEVAQNNSVGSSCLSVS